MGFEPSAYVAYSHTPRNGCIRCVFGIAAAPRNTCSQAARYGLAQPDLHRLIAPAFAGAFPYSITSVARSRMDSGTAKTERIGGLEVHVRRVHTLRVRISATWMGGTQGFSAQPIPLRATCTSSR